MQVKISRTNRDRGFAKLVVRESTEISQENGPRLLLVNALMEDQSHTT